MTTHLVECPTCGGDGGWDVPTHINRVHGGWDGYHRTCRTCKGSGQIEEEARVMTLDEALDLDAEKLAALMARPADDDGQPDEAQEWADYDRDC